MKKIASIILLATLTAFAVEAAPKIGFARDDNTVWMANLDGTGAKKIAAGVDPDISPDGAMLAFNTEDAKTPVRRIAVADLATGKVTVFKDVPSDNCFGPVWAPDSAKLLFYILIDHNWDIGLVNADGSGFRIVKKAEANGTSYFSACWMPDGQSLFCQDLQNLYRIGLDGAATAQWPLQKIFPGCDLDSNCRFEVSPDGKTLIADANRDVDSGRSGWDGPPPQVWAMDIGTQKAKALTPIFWWEPCWISNEEFLCISQGARQKLPSIYRVSLDGKTRKLVMKNATDPSVSK